MGKKCLIFLLIIVILIFTVHKQLRAEIMTDQLGRQVNVPDNPKRVVALAPSITEIIFALGQEKRLKGVTQFSDYPPETARLPRVGSYIHLDLERIVALKPDLCIATKDGNSKAVADRLEALNIPVYTVDPRDLDSVMVTILQLGHLFDAKKAQNLVSDMNARIHHIEKKVTGTAYRPRVFFQIGIAPIVSVGTDTFIHDLIVRAGGKNLAEGKTPYPRFSKEQVISLSPEVFIITSMARGEVFNKVKREWGQWENMPAVKNDRIALVDSNIFDRPTPRMVDALEELAKHIHPELFTPGTLKEQP